MKKIDAHLHFCMDRYFDTIAEAAGHRNTETDLKAAFDREGVALGIVMGNRPLKETGWRYPAFLRYCVGVEPEEIRQLGSTEAERLAEIHLRRPDCVGLKLYPGYSAYPVSDPIYTPFYDLAASYGKPVAVHTGAMAGGQGRLCYSHPLNLDDVAVQFPKVQFVMCHFGNPWLADAAAVLDKNRNVAADLSGLLEGIPELDVLFRENAGYIQLLRTWLGYLGDYDRILYGTDWPLVNISRYSSFLSEVIPARFWEGVFFENANRIYRLGL